MAVMMCSIFWVSVWSVCSLSVGAGWSLLSGARAETAVARRLAGAKAALTSFVLFHGSTTRTWLASAGYDLPTLALHRAKTLKWIHLIFKSCGSHRSSTFEDAQLLLIKNLTVGEALVLAASKVWGAHYLLGHHEVILLRSIHAFAAVHASHAKLRSTATNCPYIAGSARIFIYTSWPILVFAWNFRTVAFQSHHSTADAHYGLLDITTTLAVEPLGILLLTPDLTPIESLALVSQPSAHHVGLLRKTLLVAHHNIVLLDDGDAWYRIAIASLLVAILLTSCYLWVLNFNLRIVEDVIIVVYILDYLNWLLLTFLFWFGRARSSLVSGVATAGLLIAVACLISIALSSIVITLWLMPLIPTQMTLVPVHRLAASVSSFSSFHCWLWLCLIFIDLLWLAGFSVLENDFARIVDYITFVWIVLSEVVRASFAWFVEIELVWSLTLVLSLIFWLSFFYRIFCIFFFGLIHIFRWASFDFFSSTSWSFCWTTFGCIRAPRFGNIDRRSFFVFNSQTSLYFWFVFGSIYRWIDLKSKGIFNRYQLR